MQIQSLMSRSVAKSVRVHRVKLFVWLLYIHLYNGTNRMMKNEMSRAFKSKGSFQYVCAFKERQIDFKVHIDFSLFNFQCTYSYSIQWKWFSFFFCFYTNEKNEWIVCVAAFMLLDTPQTNTQNVFSSVVYDDGDQINCQKYPGEFARPTYVDEFGCVHNCHWRVDSKVPIRRKWEIKLMRQRNGWTFFLIWNFKKIQFCFFSLFLLPKT